MYLVTWLMVSMACAEDGSEALCPGDARVAYWQHAAMDMQSHYGVWPGIPRNLARDVLKARGFSARLVSEDVPREYDRILFVLGGESPNLVMPIRDNRALLGFLFIDEGFAESMATDVFADYRRYLCWRFGSVGKFSTLEARTRADVLGPVLVYDVMSGRSDELAIDVFRVEDPEEPGFQRIAVVFSAPDSD